MTPTDRDLLRDDLLVCEQAIREARAAVLSGDAATARDALVADLSRVAAEGYAMLEPAMGRLRAQIAFLEDLIGKLKRGETSPLRPPWTPEQAIAAFEKQVDDGYAILRGEPAALEH